MYYTVNSVHSTQCNNNTDIECFHVYNKEQGAKTKKKKKKQDADWIKKKERKKGSEPHTKISTSKQQDPSFESQV